MPGEFPHDGAHGNIWAVKVGVGVWANGCASKKCTGNSRVSRNKKLDLGQCKPSIGEQCGLRPPHQVHSMRRFDLGLSTLRKLPCCANVTVAKEGRRETRSR